MNQLPPTLTATLDRAIADLEEIRNGLSIPLPDNILWLVSENERLEQCMTHVCEAAIAALHLDDMTTFKILHPYTQKGKREQAEAEAKLIKTQNHGLPTY